MNQIFHILNYYSSEFVLFDGTFVNRSRRKANMHLNLEPIGIIKKIANKSEILIYSDFEQVIRNIFSTIGEGAEVGQKILVIHKNNHKKLVDGHQVQVTKATLLGRKGNLLTISKIEANEDSVIDVRLDLIA
jgi:hypothetical protein